jgi:hypothetical protein
MLQLVTFWNVLKATDQRLCSYSSHLIDGFKLFINYWKKKILILNNIILWRSLFIVHDLSVGVLINIYNGINQLHN